MKLPLILACRSTNTQRLHNFNWTEAKLFQHTAAAARCVGRHFQTMCACAHVVLFWPQTTAFGPGTRLAHVSTSSPGGWPECDTQRYWQYIGKTLLTIISCTVWFSFTIKLHVQLVSTLAWLVHMQARWIKACILSNKKYEVQTTCMWFHAWSYLGKCWTVSTVQVTELW